MVGRLLILCRCYYLFGFHERISMQGGIYDHLNSIRCKWRSLRPTRWSLGPMYLRDPCTRHSNRENHHLMQRRCCALNVLVSRGNKEGLVAPMATLVSYVGWVTASVASSQLGVFLGDLVYSLLLQIIRINNRDL